MLNRDLFLDTSDMDIAKFIQDCKNLINNWNMKNNTKTITKEQMASDAVEQLFAENGQTTTREVKERLRDLYPGLTWKQEWVSNFMANLEDVTFVDNGNYRDYYPSDNADDVQPIASKLFVDPSALEQICEALDNVGEPITKTMLKSTLRQNNFDLDGFKDAFKSINLVHTGKYTIDNHKIYKLIPITQHLSQTKQQVVDINKMPKKYLLNAINKIIGNKTFEQFVNTGAEEVRLLEAYFTYDLRQKLAQLI